MKYTFRDVIAGLLLLATPYLSVAQDIVFGQSAALTGPASELGREMQLGAQAYFDTINAAGGIKGRKIVLRTLDDGYDADRAVANTKKLVTDGDVLALFGYVGTPTSLPSIPIATEAKIPFFGAFTGAQGLREPFNRYVFNVRASYFNETELIVKQLMAEGVTKVAVFHQNDSYGQAGLAGVNRALASRNMKVLATATVERNTTDVAKAIDVMMNAKPEAIVMVSAYGSCAEFIKQAKSKGIMARFANVSFVGTRPLAKALGENASGVMISQVVPSPWGQKYPWVVDYQKAMKLKNEQLSHTSLEGYLAAKIAVDALRKSSDLSREGFMKALESMRDTTYGDFHVSFGSGDHNASSFVELTVLDRSGNVRY